MAKKQMDHKTAILPSTRPPWTIQPSKLADIAVNSYINVNVTNARMERHLAALRDEEHAWTDICSRFAAEGRSDERAQAAARELRDIRTNIMLTQERLAHNRALSGTLDEVLSDDQIRPHADRRIEALGRVAQGIIDNPNTDESARTFFKGFQDIFGRRRLK